MKNMVDIRSLWLEFILTYSASLFFILMTIYIRRAKEGIWNKSVKLGNSFCYTAAALLLPSLALAFTPTYTLTDLGLLPGTTVAESIRINNKGDSIAVGLDDVGTKGVLYHNGKAIDVAPTAVSSFASGINSTSQIAGYMFNGTAFVGFTYKNGKVSGFNVPGSNQTLAESLNDVGQTAGDYSPANTPLNSADHIFVKQPNGTYSDLGQFGTDPNALSINNQGRVLIGTNDSVRSHTFISRPGSTSLEEVPSLVPSGSVSPGEMNQFSVVTGSAALNLDDSIEHAYVYYNGHIKDLGVAQGSDETFGFGINNLNQIVGEAVTLPKQIKNTLGQVVGETPQISHGFVDVDGKLRDVNSLLNASGKGWVISRAQSINDLGQVLADANFNGGVTHVVKLTPNAVLPNLVP
jgi:hypothetical protein